MTLNQRIAYVGIQLWACECGEINAIICPYCGEVNAKGYSLCCDQLAQACAAVLARGGSQQEQCTGGKCLITDGNMRGDSSQLPLKDLPAHWSTVPLCSHVTSFAEIARSVVES